jgi:hypothetical protein
VFGGGSALRDPRGDGTSRQGDGGEHACQCQARVAGAGGDCGGHRDSCDRAGLAYDGSAVATIVPSMDPIRSAVETAAKIAH